MAFDAGYQAPQVPGGYVSMQEAQARDLSLRNAVQQAGQQRALGAQQLQEGALDLKQRQVDAQDQQTMREAYMQSGGDMGKTQQIMMQRGASPKAISQIQQQMLATQEAHAKLDDQQLKNEAAKAQAIGSTAQTLLGLPDEATRAINWPAARAQMLQQGHATAAEVPEQYPGQDFLTLHRNAAVTAQQSIENVNKDRTAKAAETTAGARQQAADTGAEKQANEAPGQIADATQKQITALAPQLEGAFKQGGLPAVQTLLDAQPHGVAKRFMSAAKAGDFNAAALTPDQKVMTDLRAQEVDKLNTAAQLAATASDPTKPPAERQRATDALKILKEQRPVTNVNAAAPALTPEAMQMYADALKAGKPLPSFGRAGSGTIAQISNLAASNGPVDMAKSAADFKADSASLTKYTQNLDNLSGFEGAAVKNLKMFTDAASKIPDTGVPWLNTPVRLLDSKLVGDKNMAAVNAARQIGLREIARITNDPKISGVLSDSARKEVMDFSPENATLPQIMAVAKVVMQDVANVKSSLTTQKAAIQARIGKNPAAVGATPPTAQATHRYNPKTGQIEAIQ